MKKILSLTLLAILALFNSHAQRVNLHGLKMVSEVELYNLSNGVNCILKFEYNSNRELVGVKCYGYNQKAERNGLKNEYQLKNGRLIFKDYEEDYNIYKYDFELDWNNHITRMTITPTKGQVVGSKWERNYSYKFDSSSNSYYLSKETWREWNTNVKTNTYVFLSESTLQDYEFINGCVLRIGTLYSVNKSRVNDTNLSILDFLKRGNFTLYGGFENYLSITEWLGKHHKYFVDVDNKKYSKYEYMYDERGNLIAVYLYEWWKWKQFNGDYGWGVVRSIKIKYVY